MAEKLPVVATIVDAFAVLRLLTPAIARFGWLTLVVVTGQFILVNLVMSAHGDEPQPGPLAVALLITILLGFCNLPVLTSVHRLVLQGDAARAGLTLRREEWLFLWSGFRMLPMLLLVAVPIGLMFGLLTAAIVVAMKDSGVPAAIVLVPLRLMVAAGIVAFACRYLLIFPAAAIGRQLTLGEAAALLKGNVLRLCLILIPVWFIGWLPQVFLRFLVDVLPLTGALLGACCSTVSTILFAVTLSLVFRRLTDVPAAGRPAGFPNSKEECER